MEQLWIALAVVAVGVLGTALSSAGEKFGIRWLAVVGHVLESLGSDMPKLLRGKQ